MPADDMRLGGQALLGGVMIRHGPRWGAAVRLPEGGIATVSRPVPSIGARFRSTPLLRGVVALAETVVLGVGATMWAARARDPASRAYQGAGAVLAVALGVVLAVGGFGVLPTVVADMVAPGETLGLNVVETVVRAVLLVGYLWLLGRSAQVREVLAYHGAEHQVVNAVEHGRPPTVESARACSRIHLRCGTTFLLLIVAVAFVVHLVVGRPDVWVLAVSRVVLLPVIAALAYELVRAAGSHPERAWARAVTAPGVWVQRVTTAPATDAQREVAVAAMAAAGDADVGRGQRAP